MSKPVAVTVEIEATPPARVVVTIGEPKPKRPKLTSGLLSVTLPQGNATNIPVRVDPNTNLGYICSTGKAGSFANGRKIKAKVYPGQTPTIDVMPPASATLGDVDNLGNWSFSGAKDLPGCAYANAAPGAYNTLAIWYLDTDGSLIERRDVVFQGVRSTTTQCSGSGSGSGSGSPSGKPSGSGHVPVPIGSAAPTTLYLSGDDGSSATLTKQPGGANLWVGTAAGIRYRLNGPVSGECWDQTCTLVVSDDQSAVGSADTILPDPLEMTFVVIGVTYTIIP